MYELVHERNLLERIPTGRVRDEDEDYDFDVYLWYPSSHPEVVIPVSGADFGAELPFIYERQSDDELDVTSSYWPPSSPAYSIVSDFVFPCEHDMNSAGYSNFFTSGLISTSKRVTRRLDRLLRSFRRCLRIVIVRLRS